MAAPLLPGDQQSFLTAQVRAHLRERMKKLRASTPESARATRSARIVERLKELEAFQHAEGVGLFWPMRERHEVDLSALDQLARQQGKRVYYPFLRGTTTGFARVSAPSELSPGESGFRQPPLQFPAAIRGELQLIVVPALMIAADGHRLGYGRGYYDATLPDFCPPATSVGVAFDFQLAPELPHLPHDVAVDWVVTDSQSFSAEASTPGPALPRR